MLSASPALFTAYIEHTPTLLAAVIGLKVDSGGQVWGVHSDAPMTSHVDASDDWLPCYQYCL